MFKYYITTFFETLPSPVYFIDGSGCEYLRATSIAEDFVRRNARLMDERFPNPEALLEFVNSITDQNYVIHTPHQF